MGNSIIDVDRNKCTGCGACYNRCSVNAIEMQYDRNGFIYPEVNSDQCIQCGLCKEACPMNKELIHRTKQKYYAVWADTEIRKESSSGGMFSLLADYILNLKGVVCGCAYTDDYKYAYHTIIEKKEDLYLLRKSKYIQSEIRLIYREIEDCLKKDKWVLFSGTPCQVAGLYSFLGNEYKKLVTADIICHGVPSLKAYHSFLYENAQGRKIKKVDFRDKQIASWGTVEYIEFNNNTYYYNDCYKGMWYKAFLNGISTRNSCANCKYSYEFRPADFTLGDFWGINDIEENLNDGYGTSLVLLNSYKAHNLFKRVVKNATYKEIESTKVLELAKTRNGNLLHPTPKHYAKERFFALLEHENFSSATKKTLYAKYDIGIVGWWYNLNYGGALTYYALHQVLKKMGFSVLMIAKSSEDTNYKPDIDSIPYRFALKHYYISKNHSRYDMTGLNEHCEVFISGSDQLFNPILWQWSGPEYFLHFVNNSKKKISYASSFGNEFREVGDLTEKMAYWIKRFDAISVREDYGEDIARKVFDINAIKVLDPVFLCDVQEYEELAKQSSINEAENYFLNFLLDPDEAKRSIINYAEKKLQKKYINLINADHIEENTRKLNMKNTKPNADIEDWIYYYQHSDFIITDSFHGTCFAIIFQKPFISIANRARGENRFISLLSELGLMDRLVYSFEEIKEKEWLFNVIDYKPVNEILKNRKEQSRQWLYNAIISPKDSRKNDFILLDTKISELENRLAKLERKLF